jgi:hypothetical protein
MRCPFLLVEDVFSSGLLSLRLRWGGASERGSVMKDVYGRLEEDFDLRGLSARSRKAYLAAVRQLGKHCGRPLDKLGDDDVRRYFLHLIDVRRVSPSTVSKRLYAIKFLFEVTLKRRLECLKTIRPLQGHGHRTADRDDAPCTRVHPAVPPARPAKGLSPRPVLWPAERALADEAPAIAARPRGPTPRARVRRPARRG